MWLVRLVIVTPFVRNYVNYLMNGGLWASELSEMARRIRSHAPSLLLDLGGYTADNYLAFLSHR